MTRSVRLRPWQKAALERFAAHPHPDFLAVATPGAGKTTFALTAAISRMAAPDGPRRLVVVAPTAHLKRQWATAATRFGVHLDDQWSAGSPLPTDMHGIVTTYQQVAVSAPQLAVAARGAMVVFDEIHHAGDERTWGETVRTAFAAAACRLSLSGTPFRSDTRSIPFLRYELDEARPDFEYGYGDALRDGRVVRPVYFPRTNGQMEWSAPDGSTWSASFDDALDTVRANQRLRTALSLEGDWLPTVLRTAHDRLTDIRRTHPDAGGLVVATDQDHARAIADALSWRHGVQAVVATSDDAGASDRIAAYAASDVPWLVAVRMVSEGVDIPRLRVGVYATTTTTELFFRQAVGRLVRWTTGVPSQRSYLYIPDDARLRGFAYRIAETRRHSLRRDTQARPEADPAELDALREAPVRDEEQLSLFAVISAVATDVDDPAHEPLPADADHDDSGGEELLLTLPALAGPAPPEAGAGGVVLTRREQKARLRDRNAALARDLARRTGWPHARVNAELNRLAGLRRIQDATVEQLQRRLRQAEAWHARL
ncbi:MAG TPA: DEAD/DEAH box helicase family protein [Acidimicrobiales bacterium]|nr:DEAD/DEAH box helicase family protein [Acidimicrobiales bacterium]